MIDNMAQTSILSIPSEIMFQICAFLDVRDVISLRKTCRNLCSLSHDKGLWLDFLRHQQSYLPLPSSARHTSTSAALSSSSIERIVISARKSQTRWHLPRSNSGVVQLQGSPDGYQDILYLALLLDRWILCVYSSGNVVLWDGDLVGSGDGKEVGDEFSGAERRESDPMPAVWELWGNELWTSAIAVADTGGDAIYVAVTRAQNRSQEGSTTVLMRIPLPTFSSSSPTLPTGPTPTLHPPENEPPPQTSSSPHSHSDTLPDPSSQFHDIDTFFGPDAQSLRALSPTHHLLAFSRSTLIDIVHWPSNTGITIDTHSEDLDQLWNGIIGIQFVYSPPQTTLPPPSPDPSQSQPDVLYLLCVKARTLELYRLTLPFAPHSSYFVNSALEPLPSPSSITSTTTTTMSIPSTSSSSQNVHQELRSPFTSTPTPTSIFTSTSTSTSTPTTTPHDSAFYHEEEDKHSHLKPSHSRTAPGHGRLGGSARNPIRVAPVGNYAFPGTTTFRGVSISSVSSISTSSTTSHSRSDQLEGIELSFLAHDVLRGIFHYRVVMSPPEALSSNVPYVDMCVELVGMHNMARAHPLPIPRSPTTSSPTTSTSNPASTSTTTTSTPSSSTTSTPTRPLTSRSHRQPGKANARARAPGFIGAAALGPQGRRGVWVERTKSVPWRRVVVFSAYGSQSRAPEPLTGTDDAERTESAGEGDDGDGDGNSGEETESGSDDDEEEDDEEEEEELSWTDAAGGRPCQIDARTVYEVHSYDLREDLLHVAFSEVTGRIVLGTRAGGVKVV